MDKLVLNSYAKLNLYLQVLNKRRDNYHNIKTVFERIGLSDRILLRARPDRKIKLICKEPLVPKDNTNLCFRAAKLVQESFNIEHGLDIKIIKRIPVGSGLAGGSSNAAAVLLGLNKLWRLNLSRSALIRLAKNIGSDVPFFVYNTSFAQGSGRGDRIKVLKVPKSMRLWHILVVPKIKVSTPFIYKRWDKRPYSKLTIPKYDVKILLSGLRKNDLSLIGKLLFNSLEEVTLRLYPEVARIKEKLLSLGAKSILMSGSGPAVFGIVSSRKEAVTLSRKLKKQDGSWRVFVTRTF